MINILDELTAILEERRKADPKTSYVANLYHQGLNKILEKMGEEATETILAAKDAYQSHDTRDLIHETADLWFHSIVMLVYLGSSPEAVLQELQRRLRIPGLDEKASRKIHH